MTLKKLPTHWLCSGKTQLTNSLFETIRNKPCFLKPDGGLWISPYTPRKRFKSDWLEWCYDASFRDYKQGVILTLPNNTKIYTIDSQKDLMSFIDEVGLNKEPDWFTYWKIPNFEKAAEKYDAIYLTKKGQRDTHIPWKNPEYTTYGWDCESMLLLKYKIKSQRPIILDSFLEESQKAQILPIDLLQKVEA